jgi:hypothetical protein
MNQSTGVFVQLAEAYSWPLFGLVVLFVFRPQWKSLLDRADRVRIRSGSLGFEVQLQAARATERNEKQEQENAVLDRDDLDCDRESDPSIMILVEWSNLSLSLMRAYVQQLNSDGIPRSAKEQIRKLHDCNKLTTHEARALDALRVARNAIVYRRQDAATVSISQAREFQVLAAPLIKRLDELGPGRGSVVSGVSK